MSPRRFKRQPQQTLPVWGFYRSLTMPVICLLFLWVQPSNLFVLLAFMLLPNALDFLSVLHAIDKRSPALPAGTGSLEAIPLIHFALHMLNLYYFLVLLKTYGLFSFQVLAGFWLLVQASSLSAPTVGHELIHRKSSFKRTLGRILLASIFFEHFYTEHIRGHHRYVGLPQDYSTAGLGESFLYFLQRSTPGQFTHAWQIERRRLQRYNRIQRIIRNGVYQGVCMEITLLFSAYFIAGLAGLGVFVVHGMVVYILSQTFNYLLHWGLARKPGDTRGSAHLSWDCNDQNVLFTMLCITRHAYHHRAPNKAFYELQHSEQSPELPLKLVTAFWLILFRNAKFRKIMTAELTRLKLISLPARGNA